MKTLSKDMYEAGKGIKKEQTGHSTEQKYPFYT